VAGRANLMSNDISDMATGSPSKCIICLVMT
jgi:hypothetical protein